MNSKILKISSSLMAVGIMAPTILFTTNEAKAYIKTKKLSKKLAYMTKWNVTLNNLLTVNLKEVKLH
ncbi:TPA: hypothetical protein ACONLI_002810 [Staphylococcus aureus]